MGLHTSVQLKEENVFTDAHIFQDCFENYKPT